MFTTTSALCMLCEVVARPIRRSVPIHLRYGNQSYQKVQILMTDIDVLSSMNPIVGIVTVGVM